MNKSIGEKATVINISNLVKKFDDLEAVRGVSFTAYSGECLGLLGPNGAGKTDTPLPCGGDSSSPCAWECHLVRGRASRMAGRVYCTNIKTTFGNGEKPADTVSCLKLDLYFK